MANPNPTCLIRVNGGAQVATAGGVNVNGGDTVEIDLASVAGVSIWVPSLVGQDDVVAPPTLTVNNTNKTATFTAPAAPFALIFQSQVNSGRDVNNVAQSSYTTTFGIYALSSGNRLFASNERFEGSTLFGWITKFNGFIRSGGGGGGGGAFNNQRATGAAPSITVTASSTPQGAWYRSVSSGGTCVLPTSPTAGQVVQIVDEDGTATQFGITVNGGSNTIVAYAAGASTYAFSNANGYAARSVLNLTWNAAAGFWKVT